MPDLFDTHCHLTDRAFTDPKQVLLRARDNGVGPVLTVGLERRDCAAALELAGKHEQVFAGIGIHPHEADRFQPGDVDFLRRLAQDPKVRGIGETGLDLFKNYAARENQLTAFHAHVELAQELNLPLILHIRDAYPESLAVLKEHGYFSGVMHCFSGNREFALEAVGLGFYVSFSGSLTYGGQRLADAARAVPRERLLVETDAPYLTPVPFRGKRRNEPAMVRYTLDALARIRNLPSAEMARVTTENGKRLFGIP